MSKKTVPQQKGPRAVAKPKLTSPDRPKLSSDVKAGLAKSNTMIMGALRTQKELLAKNGLSTDTALTDLIINLMKIRTSRLGLKVKAVSRG
jgi:hypothetical protein